MDENYLDNLLNEVSLDKEIDHKIEEELDSQIQTEKRRYQEQQSMSDEDLFNMGLENDVNGMQSEQDLHFSQEQIDELDQLDNLADLDIGDLDFSDIDFDDLDVTKLDDIETDDLDALLKDFEGDLEIDNFYDSSKDGDKQNISNEYSKPVKENHIFDVSDDMTQGMGQGQKDALNEDAFNTDEFLDSLLEETEKPTKAGEMNEFGVENIPDALTGDANTSESSEEQLPNEENDDLDDLLALLDMEGLSDDNGDNEYESVTNEHASLHNLDAAADLDQLDETVKEKHTAKQRFMEILFGEPDEDDVLAEEELAQIEAKRAAKKAKKLADKKAHDEKTKVIKEAKKIKNDKKKKETLEKKKFKAQKKARLKAQEPANVEPEKPLNKAAVAFIFTILLGGTFLLFVGTDSFNYSLAIERATQYFSNQKYRKAYDEIAGVEVKEKDEDLKDRIYTVMYVERLYESYLNNMELDRSERALDCLLRGVSKYYEHYEEAKVLGITSDLDYSFSQIQTVLNEQYGITMEQAIEINQLTNYEYVQYIQSVVGSDDSV